MLLISVWSQQLKMFTIESDSKLFILLRILGGCRLFKFIEYALRRRLIFFIRIYCIATSSTTSGKQIKLENQFINSLYATSLNHTKEKEEIRESGDVNFLMTSIN